MLLQRESPKKCPMDERKRRGIQSREEGGAS